MLWVGNGATRLCEALGAIGQTVNPSSGLCPLHKRSIMERTPPTPVLRVLVEGTRFPEPLMKLYEVYFCAIQLVAFFPEPVFP